MWYEAPEATVLIFSIVNGRSIGRLSVCLSHRHRWGGVCATRNNAKSTTIRSKIEQAQAIIGGNQVRVRDVFMFMFAFLLCIFAQEKNFVRR